MSMRPSSRGIPVTGRILLLVLALITSILLWPSLFVLIRQILFGILLAAAALPFSRRLEKRLSPSLAAFLSIAALFTGALGLIALLVPHIISQISLIIAQAPALLARAQGIWADLSAGEFVSALGIDTSAPQEWLKRLGAWAGEQLPLILSSLGAWADGLSKAFLAPLLAFYFLRDREIFSYHMCLWIPARHRKRALHALKEMRREAGGYIRGQMLVALSVSALTALGLLLLGIPAWLALGLLMGLCELIPYVGPLIGAVPIIIFSLPMGITRLLWALGIVILVQQIESWFLSPHLMAGATGLHPVYVVLLLSAGGLLLGLMGMVIALPVFVCLRGACRVLYATREGENVKTSAAKGKMPD